MKAIICDKYGAAANLKLEQAPKPIPATNELLIKIKATAINDFDWSLVRGLPLPYRLLFGLFKPRTPIPGIELAGIVESVGDKVSAFQPGDAVYGDISEDRWGSFAEYVCVNHTSVVHKPGAMTFEQAAAIPHASILAWQGLVDIGSIQPGQTILINGAGGGVGTFGLQIARHFGARSVTGVDTAEKLKTMENIGFDQVIDYRKKDFTRNGIGYDLILDTKTNRPPSAYKRSLNPGGTYVTVGGNLIRLLQLLLAKGLGAKNLNIVALKPNRELDRINDLFTQGKIEPLIDGPYKLEQIPELLQYFGDGKHNGKVIISL